jgi:hypothetical protein
MAHLSQFHKTGPSLGGVKKKRRIVWRGVIRRCRKGERLCQKYSGVRTAFFLDPSGIRVRASHARAAIGSGELTSMDDGLFKWTTQTWVAKGPRS